MSTVATRHPAILARDAMNAVTTELVHADIAPTYFSVGFPGGERVWLGMNLDTRADFDAVATLFGFGSLREYDGHDGVRMVRGDAMYLGVRVDASAPAFPAVVADCDSVGPRA